jgi:4-aminobutyrate aminotransferase-like enzyme
MADGASVNKSEVILAHKKHIFPSVFHYFSEPLVVTKAKDQFVWDADGNKYLDFFGGIVTISVGHCNDAVNKKVKEQVDTLEHVSTAYITEPQVKLAQKIAPKTPNGALSKFYFTNSGTEANETAFLTARMYTGSQEIVALRHSYHGRSAAAMAAWVRGGWAGLLLRASAMR